MDPLKRRDWIAAEFDKCYGTQPTLWTRAPAAVDLMGSHTDYNDGFILTMTLDLDTWLAVRPRPIRPCVCIANLNASGEISLAAIAFDPEHPWLNYVSGVAKVLQDAGFTLCGFDGMLHSTIPIASGLSSSAALEMAVARHVRAGQRFRRGQGCIGQARGRRPRIRLSASTAASSTSTLRRLARRMRPSA